MSTNLDYLDPNLLPLEDKLNAYLAAEKALRAANTDSASLPQQQQQQALAADEFEQRSVAGSFPQHAEEVRDQLQNLQQDLERLRHEILALLPVRNEWVKVNLGYGPSRVGAFDLPGQPAGTYELRVVH
ncbi:hypothetical protein [Hymenobacter sp. APR13]|uniref:hypothetical protein n=1 Tax=Hymenobacter sp. APR13 TaxID=1356852 RepID=UPI0004E096C0|nr:hypothetical protein [Hymenobacter sp. APR13]AII50368.1 hypothetical protein N008_00010 [Hymenobacter sp. APR13]